MSEIQSEKELVEKARVSKDEFISNVTHEMNTPLTSIHGYAELLQAGGMTESQTKTAYKTILTQSERLTNLIAVSSITAKSTTTIYLLTKWTFPRLQKKRLPH